MKKSYKIVIIILVVIIVAGYFIGTLSPARNLTGTWIGTFSSNEDIADGTCLAKGDFQLKLKQRGNNLDGTIDYKNLEVESNYRARIPTPCAAPVDGTWSSIVTGTVSSSALELQERGQVIFTGSFTTDLMQLSIEECVIQSYSNCKQLNEVLDTIKLTRK